MMSPNMASMLAQAIREEFSAMAKQKQKPAPAPQKAPAKPQKKGKKH